MPKQTTRLGAHLLATGEAACLLGLCQITIEVLLIAAFAHGFLLTPYEFYSAQIYDASVKLLLWIPGAGALVKGGALDHFYDQDFLAKLSLAGGLLLPNAIVMGALGGGIATIRWLLERPARCNSVLWAMIAICFALHTFWWLSAPYVARSWTILGLAKNLGRVFFYEGVCIAYVALALAAIVSFAIARRRPVVRWSFSTGLALACIATLTLPSSAAPMRRETEPAPLPAAAARAPVDNLILISIDSLRADRLGAYGNPHATSPTMDRLASEGALFTEVMSPSSWTLPSHVSLMTGRDVLAHGVMTDSGRIPETLPIMAERLRNGGLATGGIVAWEFVGSKYGFDRGFDYFDESIINDPDYHPMRAEPAEEVADLAIAWLRRQREKRFFLFLHFWDVHYDYAPPPPYDTMFDPDYQGTVTAENFHFNKAINKHIAPRDLEHLLALYDGEIRWVDDQIARIIDLVSDLGLRERTAIIVTSDHGDEFFEHGYKGHRLTLYREVMHIPLIIVAPGVAAGQRIDEPASLVDVTPTVFDLLGVSRPAGFNGSSLVGAMNGGTIPQRSGVYGWLCNQKRGTYCQAMQHDATGTLIHRFQPNRIEYFEAEDRLQKKNLVAEREGMVTRQLVALRQQLNDFWSQYASVRGESGTVTFDPATAEKMRSLGYGDH